MLFSEVITEQVQTEEALLENKSYNRMLFEQSAIGLALAGMDGKLIDVNNAYASIIGRTVEETLRLTYFDITPEKYSSQEKEQLRQLETSGHYGPYVKEYIHKDGHLVPVRLQGSIVERNNRKYIWSSAEDITSQKQVEEELRQSEERFKVLHNASFGGIAIHDKGVILECNQGLSDVSGYSMDELIGMNGILLIAVSTRDLVKEKILASYGKPYEAVGLRKNGEEYPVRIEGRNIPYKGKMVRVTEFRDIAEQKR